jgi:hypothetical protein
MVWKTTNAGTTWTRVNDNYDWENNHSGLWRNLRTTLVGGIRRPQFFDSFGGKMTVDNTGKLHYVTAVVPMYSAHPDSLGYSYTYPFTREKGQCTEVPHIYDFVTDGNGTWTPMFVDYLFGADLAGDAASDTTANVNPWNDTPPAKFAYDNRIQVSRSATGGKIFYSWAETDTAQSQGQNQYTCLTNPSIRYKGYDVASNLMTATKNNDFSNTNAGFYFHYVADIAMNPSAGNWTLPATYVDSRSGAYSTVATVDVYYVDDLNLNNAEFTVAVSGAAACTGFNAILESNNISSISQNFPNPFSSTSVIKVGLNKAEDITVNIYNTFGQLVMNKNVKGVSGNNEIMIDAANLTSGIYYYTVQAGGAEVSKKMVIQK